MKDKKETSGNESEQRCRSKSPVGESESAIEKAQTQQENPAKVSTKLDLKEANREQYDLGQRRFPTLMRREEAKEKKYYYQWNVAEYGPKVISRSK